MDTSADTERTGSARAPGPLFLAGACALLTAVAIDTLAVIGRHIGHSLLGSIELVQAAMLFTSASAVVGATVARKHATVHLVVNRLRQKTRARLERVNALLSALFFIGLAIGSGWIAWDLRASHEQSDVLHVPYGALRIVCVLAVSATALILLRQSLGRSSR